MFIWIEKKRLHASWKLFFPLIELYGKGFSTIVKCDSFPIEYLYASVPTCLTSENEHFPFTMAGRHSEGGKNRSANSHRVTWDASNEGIRYSNVMSACLQIERQCSSNIKSTHNKQTRHFTRIKAELKVSKRKEFELFFFLSWSRKKFVCSSDFFCRGDMSSGRKKIKFTLS